jgi:ssDNA-binding Zn-finger/Zn-ribbon topoisomerase 1
MGHIKGDAETLTENDKKSGQEKPDDLPEKDESFEEGDLISFTENEADQKPVPEAPPTPEPDFMSRDGSISVDDVLSRRRPLEFDMLETKPEPGSAKPAAGQPEPVKEFEPEPPPVKKKRPLEIRVHSGSEGRWKITQPDPETLDSKVREKAPRPIEVPSGKVRVDHEHLSKLDHTLKLELQNIREKTERGFIPGEFLEARRLLSEEGILECPTCKVKVEDTPGEIDHCPRCGLALDDYLGKFKEEWNRKHKHAREIGVLDLEPKKKRNRKTSWELWKEEQGLDPDAELLRCPECGHEEYDDPFVANKCPKCRIPLDLHLQFPRPYIRKREASLKRKRFGVDLHEIEKERKKK